jgi:hypothetical protein
MATSVNIDDVLMDDTEIYNQKFFVLSFILPGNKNDLVNPLFKMRGAFKSYEEAEKRIEKLKSSDRFFDMYICEVGKWGSLLPEEQILKSDDITTVYRDENLNEIFSKYKENRILADEEHKTRKDLMKRKALEEGTANFQKYLSFCDKVTSDYLTPQTTSLEEFQEYKNTIKNVNGYLEFFKILRTCESDLYLRYRDKINTPEELSEEIVTEIKKFF